MLVNSFVCDEASPSTTITQQNFKLFIKCSKFYYVHKPAH